MNSGKLKTIAYLSSASVQFREDALEKILKTSVKNNRAIGVTGMLIYADNCFFQIIEGPEENIDPLFKKISYDNRHKDVVKVMSDKITTRSFADWSMGGLILDPKILEHKEAFKLTRLAIQNKLPPSTSEIIKVFVNTFYNSSTRYMD